VAGKSVNLIYEILANDKASGKLDGLNKKFNEQEKALKGLRTAGTLQFAALAAGATVFAKESIQAFLEADQSQVALQGTLKKFPALADTNLSALDALNRSLMNKVAVDDDAIASGQAILGQFKLTGAQLEQLTPLMVDYAKRTGKDIPTSAMDLGRAMLGNGRALKNVGIKFKETGTEAGNFAELVDALSATVGGYAETQAKSAVGQTEMLKVKFEKLQESVGKKLLPALLELIGAGNDAIDWIDNNQGAAEALAITVGVLSTAIGVAANWQKLTATYTTLATAAEWLYNTAIMRSVTVKAADAAATAASQAAIAGLTAQTAAATTATTANAAATRAQATEMRPMMKGGLIIGGVLAGFTALTAAVEALPFATRQSSLSIAETTAALLEMAATGKDLKGAFDFQDDVFGLTGHVDSLTDAAKRIADPSLINRVDDFAGSVRGLFGKGDTSRTRSIEQIDTLGQSLASLVQSGNAGKAAQQFSMLSDEWVRGGGSVDELRKLMPAYTDALANASNQQQLATGSTVDMTEATDDANFVTAEAIKAAQDNADAVLSLVDAIQQQIDKQRQLSGKALDENSALRGYKQAIDDASQALTDNGVTLDVNTQKGRDNQAALDAIASSTWDWVDAGSKAGVSQVDLASRMANGRQAFIDSATQMGLTTAEASALATQLNLIPSNVVTNVTLAGYPQVYAYLSDIQTRLRSITGDAHIRIATGVGGSGGLAFADGGAVWGAGTATSDSILAALSNGEFVHTAAAHKFWTTDGMQAINNQDVAGLMAVMANRGLASGGAVTRQFTGVPASSSIGASVSSAPVEAVFHLYGADGVLMGTMRGVAEDQSRAVAEGRNAAVRRR